MVRNVAGTRWRPVVLAAVGLWALVLLGLGLSVPWSDVLDGWVDYGVLARPGSLPAARYLAVYSPAVFMAGLAARASCCC